MKVVKSLLKFIKNLLFISVPTFFVLLIILELFFRFVLPASNPPIGYFHMNEKIFSFSNSRKVGFNYTGKFKRVKARWSINNMNWNYTIDYYPVQDKKLIAVIGDSYVEAFQVDADKNYPFLLRNKLIDEYEVYAFGKSGASLSQYLHVSRYVNKHLNPDILIFNLVHNDFDESIYEFYPHNHYFMQITYNEDQGLFSETVPRPNYATSQFKPWKRGLQKSALFRYLYRDIGISNFTSQIIKGNNDNVFEENTNPLTLKRREEMVYKATKYLVKTIRNENIDKRVIFVFDAPRQAIYEDALESSMVWWLHDMMLELSQKFNVEFIDLTGEMKKAYLEDGRRFNSFDDWHWNNYGHEFVAGILFDYFTKDN